MAENLISLDMLNIGEEARLVTVLGGRWIRRRLSALGLCPGTKVTMIQNAGWGPVILGVMDSRVALGRGMAQKILVTKD